MNVPKRRQPAVIDPLEPRLLLSVTDSIRNGAFAGTVSTSDWIRSGNFQTDSRFGNYHSSPGYAYLADFNGNPANSIAGTISQQLTLPSAGTSLTLNFWTKITTAETGSSANDTMTVQVMDSTGTTLLQNLATYSNLSANSSYIQRTFFLNRSLFGQTVRLVFSAANDAANATVFRIDDVSLLTVAPASNNRVVGYLPNSRFSYLNQIDLSALTHINYAFASLDTDGDVVTNGWVTTTSLDSTVAAAHAAGDTVSITFFSNTSTSYPKSEYPVMAASATARTNFANQAVAFCLAHNLDGIDIDWEPPYSNNNPDYAALIDALYAAGHSQRLLITAAVNPFTNEIPAATVNSEMDWLNIMCYEFAPANFSTYNDSVSGMQDWTLDGVQKNKLLMGVPFYGKTGATFGTATAHSVGTILNDYKTQFGSYPGPDVDSYTDTSGNVWYWNGITTTEKKAAYIRDNGYGGLMIWELSQDHWDSNSAYDKNSLLPVLKSIMKPPSWLAPTSGSRFDLVAGTFYMHAGVATLTSDTSSANPNLSISVSSGATLNINSFQHIATLNVDDLGLARLNAGSNKALVAQSLTIASTGKLDLADNALILNYSAASPLSTIKSYLITGRGGTDFGMASWNGPGIDSSVAAAQDGVSFAIGYVENSFLPNLGVASYNTFMGQTVDSTSILVRYTRGADATLDGVVDSDDVTLVGLNYNSSGTGDWFLGDFDYDGKCDSDDVTMLGLLYNPSAPPLNGAFSNQMIAAESGTEAGSQDPPPETMADAIFTPPMSLLS